VSSEPYSATVHRAWAADLDPPTLYALLRLRVDVFVVEQQTAYPELDGRDLEPTTRHFWIGSGTDPEVAVACLRLLAEPGGGYRIGRVCTARQVRGRGLSGRLMAAALADVGDAECVLDAQVQVAPIIVPACLAIRAAEGVLRLHITDPGAREDWLVELIGSSKRRKENLWEEQQSDKAETYDEMSDDETADGLEGSEDIEWGSNNNNGVGVITGGEQTDDSSGWCAWLMSGGWVLLVQASRPVSVTVVCQWPLVTRSWSGPQAKNRVSASVLPPAAQSGLWWTSQ